MQIKYEAASAHFVALIASWQPSQTTLLSTIITSVAGPPPGGSAKHGKQLRRELCRAKSRNVTCVGDGYDVPFYFLLK